MGNHCHRSLPEARRSRLVHKASTFRQRAQWVSESASGACRDARSNRVGWWRGSENGRNEESEEGEGGTRRRAFRRQLRELRRRHSRFELHKRILRGPRTPTVHAG